MYDVTPTELALVYTLYKGNCTLFDGRGDETRPKPHIYLCNRIEMEANGGMMFTYLMEVGFLRFSRTRKRTFQQELEIRLQSETCFRSDLLLLII